MIHVVKTNEVQFVQKFQSLSDDGILYDSYLFRITDSAKPETIAKCLEKYASPLLEHLSLDKQVRKMRKLATRDKDTLWRIALVKSGDYTRISEGYVKVSDKYFYEIKYSIEINLPEPTLGIPYD